MNTNLAHTLRNLRAYRLKNYGNTAYQRISGDWNFEHVPFELMELWYGQDTLSFITLSIEQDSAIDCMSHNELVRWIANELYLIDRLEKFFLPF